MANSTYIKNNPIIGIGHTIDIVHYQEGSKICSRKKHINGDNDDALVNQFNRQIETYQERVYVFIHIADVWPDMQSTGQQ